MINNAMELKMNSINIPPTFKITEEQFQALATANRDLRLERTANGELIIMPLQITPSEEAHRVCSCIIRRFL
jgi:Uma2 family endonuclease